ncbi:hypothetical protein A5784_36710 [Mycobacterium sp. 852013-50091_SCH5140682]|uniref:hypothetical protein n=1 Tax=Mycobacterium sp. 852013-50091_SCH5140682 TaxID=1834109 RepID=UPI0007EA4C3B|nr:hypothetical protein [Mycobacterium sp. 852013-50091_SCH5140682]OBC10321.1 hypothetical protein A5784_36710 [Mycobacterium sp. 852013-50091_SCH5140682]
MTARPLLGALLISGVLLTACHSSIEGAPVTSPPSLTEPTFPTPRPSRSSPAPSPSTTTPPAPTTSQAPPGATALEPTNGYVFIQTKSGKTRCQISSREVGCESDFTNSPIVDGAPANGIRVSTGGQTHWVLGNLGDIPAVTLDYRTYRALGWTIDAGNDGTRFTNDATGHGMVVAVQGVESF